MYDALIIGGGPAGATTGLLLAKAGWSVAIIEKKAFPRRKVCGEFMSAATISLLHELGIHDEYFSLAGPCISDVGLFSGSTILSSPMPQKKDDNALRGHALGREHLDSILLEAAKRAGVTILQPWTAYSLKREASYFSCDIGTEKQNKEILAQTVIMAHGSWEKNIVENKVYPHKPSDLLAFKAHFKDGELKKGLMPLIAFPGGYGGIVHTDSGRISLSCCVRRDRLKKIRLENPGMGAGEAVFRHLLSINNGIKKVLVSAQRDGAWLSAGPIRPGLRTPYADDIFYVGNIAGEAHPVIAEGISMAIQSAWLLAKSLIAYQNLDPIPRRIASGNEYTTRWKERFTRRIYAAALFANIASNSPASMLCLPLIKKFPQILTFGARLSGKI